MCKKKTADILTLVCVTLQEDEDNLHRYNYVTAAPGSDYKNTKLERCEFIGIQTQDNIKAFLECIN